MPDASFCSRVGQSAGLTPHSGARTLELWSASTGGGHCRRDSLWTACRAPPGYQVYPFPLVWPLPWVYEHSTAEEN